MPTNDVLIPPPATPGSTSGCEAVRLRRRPPAEPADRADPARHLHLRGQGEERPGRRLRRGHHLQRGPARPRRAVHRHPGHPRSTIPVVGLSFADGAALYAATQAGPVAVTGHHVDRVEPRRHDHATSSRTRPAATPNKVLVVGAHLDSVVEGPGINDNGSGTATILEIAEQMADAEDQAAAEGALRVLGRRGGRPARLRALRRHAQRRASSRKIFANLNFDMLGSPNYVRFVYDGDGSATGTAGPPGSAQIEDIFNEYFAGAGPGHRPDRVRRPVRLRPVHRRRHPGRRPVQRRRGHQDRGAGGGVRRHRRCGLRPLLPPGLRHHQQPQHQRPWPSWATRPPTPC